MEKLNIALLLLNLNKAEANLLVYLYFLYKKHKDTEGKKYKLEELSELLGIDKPSLIDLLNKLEVRNILGKVVYEEGLTDKKVVKGLTEDFVGSLVENKKPIVEAVSRVGFYITDDEVLFVLNPIRRTWKYPANAKVQKAIKSLENISDDKLLGQLKDSIKKGRKSANSSINSWNLHETIVLFQEKYRVNYNSIYAINARIEYSHMKNILLQLHKNNLSTDRLEDFFNYSFKRAKSKKSVLQISHLKYYANEFMTNIIKNKTDGSDFYYDTQGNLRRKSDNVKVKNK